MDATVLAPGTRPRPERWPDMTSNESEPHSLDWTGVLKGATISAIAWASSPSGLVFSGSTIAGAKTTITITPPALTFEREYLLHAKMTDSNGAIHETNPPIRLKVQPGGDF